MRNFDTVVVGAGVFGAWTAYRLRQAGHSVALIDAYGPGNSRSSSGGESRIIRMSYGPDEIYTRFAMESLADWRDTLPLGLFFRTGVLWTAPEGHPRAFANREALVRADVPHEVLSQSETESRFPQFRFSWPITAIWEPESGGLLARRCVQAIVGAATRIGVDYLHAAASVPCEGEIRLSTGQVISAGNFVYACGPWLPKLFPELLAGRIRVTRQEIFFYGTASGDERFTPPAMPIWLDYGDPRGGYTIPDLESRGFKLAFDAHGPEIDPDSQERVVSAESVAKARTFLAERFPALANAPVLETRVCQYENTSNGDFLLDRHPGYPNVWLAGGGSGHGFKHGPAVGRYLTGLITGTGIPEPRFGLAAKTASRERSIY